MNRRWRKIESITEEWTKVKNHGRMRGILFFGGGGIILVIVRLRSDGTHVKVRTSE
jgi:hypothetical protein